MGITRAQLRAKELIDAVETKRLQAAWRASKEYKELKKYWAEHDEEMAARRKRRGNPLYKV